MNKIKPFKIFEKNENKWPLPLTVKIKKDSKPLDIFLDFYGGEEARTNAFVGWEDLGKFTNRKDFLDFMLNIIDDDDYNRIVRRINSMEERFIYGDPNKNWRHPYELASGSFDDKGNLKKKI